MLLSPVSTTGARTRMPSSSSSPNKASSWVAEEEKRFLLGAHNSCSSTASLSTCSSSSSSLVMDEEEGSANAPLLLTKKQQQAKESSLESYLYPNFGTGELPSQADAARWLKYLIYIPLVTMVVAMVSTEFSLSIAIKYGMIKAVEAFARNLWYNTLVFRLICASMIFGLVMSLLTMEVYTMVMLLRGRQRRSLPTENNKRLIHAVVICQYKEPLDILDATVQSLVESTLAHNTIIVLACEARDPYADEVFATLESRYSHHFRNFLKTDHRLAPGEVIGKSSNENHAVRELYSHMTEKEQMDPFQVMVTVCDADSLFDPVFLEHVEAEFWRMPDGRRAIYNAPINTYRNLSDCNLLVQAVEISRCHYDTFIGLTGFRPSQSNYSLTLGFCHEVGYWDPTNTAEDFHTAIKAMAMSGQGKSIVVPVWSLILNDSVCSFHDRWTQAKRHMWGVEECAWTLELFWHLRFKRWASLMGITLGTMLLGKNCIPTGFLFLLLPSVRQLFFSLETSTKTFLVGMFVVQQFATWLQVVVREIFLRRYILAGRKHMKPVVAGGWKNQFLVGLLATTPFVWLIIEQLSLVIFFTGATWSMLWHARTHNTILYVTAPKALSILPEDEEKTSNSRSSKTTITEATTTITTTNNSNNASSSVTDRKTV